MTETSSKVPGIQLNSGGVIPQLGLGVWQAEDAECERAVQYALEVGYRHVDTAAAYGNEEAVGRGLAAGGVDRDEYYVTTKLWNADQGYEQTFPAFSASLDKLGLDYVDLYLIHWPLQDAERRHRTWDALVDIQASGRARSIGVCNFEPHHLAELLEHTDVVPAVDQVELHPHLPQHQIRDYATEHGIAVESWSPLGGSPRKGKASSLLSDPVITAVGDRYGKSPAQVLIRWHLQQGLIVIPKSVHEERIAANLDVFDFELDADDLATIDGLDDGQRFGAHPDTANFGAPD